MARREVDPTVASACESGEISLPISCSANDVYLCFTCSLDPVKVGESYDQVVINGCLVVRATSERVEDAVTAASYWPDSCGPHALLAVVNENGAPHVLAAYDSDACSWHDAALDPL